MKTTVYSLPREVLIRIFEHLDVHHRLVVGQVCKAWLDATNCRLLLKEVKLAISPVNEQALRAFPSTIRQFKCFTFHQVNIDSFFLLFLKQFSGQLVSLSFTQCQLDRDYFYKYPAGVKKLSCDKLQYLKVCGCDAFSLFSSLPNVTTFEILDCSDLTDCDINKINKLMPNLATLKFGNHIACDPRAYKRFYIKGNTVENEPSDAILSFPAVRNFIARRSRTLVSLDLSGTNLSPSAVVEISTIHNLRLQTMFFGFDLSGSRIAMFCQNQLALTSLDLSTALNLSDEILSNICRILVNLRELVIVFKHKIDVGIIDIFKLNHLQKLNLNFCSNITPFSFQRAISESKTCKLKHLNLAFTKIEDSALRKLLFLNGNIEHLDLTFTNVSNATLHLICKSLPRLKTLILNSCKHIGDSGLTGEHSEISECSSPGTCVPLSNLKDLRVLDLSKNSRITGGSCTQSIRFKHLEVLRLYGCDLLGGPSVMCNLTALNPSLREIQFANDLDDVVV